MHRDLQLEMEKPRVTPFFIPKAKYVVCASNTNITYFAQNKINFFLSYSYINCLKTL